MLLHLLRVPPTITGGHDIKEFQPAILEIGSWVERAIFNYYKRKELPHAYHFVPGDVRHLSITRHKTRGTILTVFTEA